MEMWISTKRIGQDRKPTQSDIRLIDVGLHRLKHQP